MIHVLEVCFIIIFILINTNIKPKVYFTISLLMLSILAYFFDPVYLNDVKGQFTDAYRFFNDMDLARWQGESYDGYASAPLSGLYIVAIASLGDNHLLPMITCLLSYGIAFYLLYRIGKRNGNTDSDIIKSAFCFIMIEDYVSVIANVRYHLAMILFTVIAYHEIIENKKKWRFVYFVLPLFHPGVLCFVLLRILAEFKWKFAIPFMVFIVGIVNFYSEKLFLFLLSLSLDLGINPYYFIDMQYKYEEYQDINNWTENTFGREVIAFIIIMIFIIWLIRAYRKMIATSNESWLRVINIGLWSGLIALGFVNNYQMQTRFLIIYTIIIPIIFLLTKRDYNWNLHSISCTSILYYMIIIVSIINYFGQTFGYNLLVFYGE